MLTEPVGWLIVFHRYSSRRWVEMICPGRWKHVSAVGFVSDAGAWVHVSWELGRLRIDLVPDAGFEPWLARLVNDGAVLRVKAPEFDFGPWRPRAGLFCTSMIAHLVGLRGGALLPENLWRRLLANGAEIVTGGRPLSAQGTAGPAVGDRADGLAGGGARTA